MSRLAAWVLIGLCLIHAACNPEFDVTADAREAYVVYGVLNPAQDTQYIKITRVFQTDSDALVYADQNDLTVRFLDVTLETDSTIRNAIVVDHIPRAPGIFMQAQAIYAIPSAGLHSLAVGSTATLRIRKPGDETFEINCSTRIPLEPKIKGPDGPYVGPDGRYFLPGMDFTTDEHVYFKNIGAFSYEVRIIAAYQQNGEDKTVTWRHPFLFLPNNGCYSSPDEICYEIGAFSVPRTFSILTLKGGTGDITYMDSPTLVYDADSLPQSCRVEVTAVDSFLTLFMIGNDPGSFGLNLLMDKQEYSNVSGNNYGIFGSISTHSEYVRMDVCSQFLGGLAQGVPPVGCTWQ